MTATRKSASAKTVESRFKGADCGITEARAVPAATASDGTAAAAEVDPLAALRDNRFRDAIGELEGLLSQSRRSFLLGAGCSVCAGLPMMDALTSAVQAVLEEEHKRILDGIRVTFSGPGRVTIEDFMSELVDHISLAERRVLREATSPTATINGTTYDHKTLRDALQKTKAAIAAVISKQDTMKQIGTHREFVRAVHGTLKSGKTAAAKRPVDYFTLNYDTLLEDALALERIPLRTGRRITSAFAYHVQLRAV